MTRTAVCRVLVTRVADDHRFVRASTLAAALAVYGDGYRLREVWGIALADGFHYLSDGEVPS